MAHTYSELKGLTWHEVVEEHDNAAKGCGSRDWLALLRDELRHRQHIRYTRAITWLTIVITVATIFNVVLWAWGKL